MREVTETILRLVGEGEIHAALERLDRELLRRPDDPTLLALQARTLMADMQYDAALQVWRELAIFGPSPARAHLEKARCLAELGAESEAAEAVEAAIALDVSLRSEAEADWRFHDIFF